MKIELKNRWTGSVIFTHETDAGSVTPEALGEAVLAAIKSGADLRRADLSGASLTGADLSDANLSDANLSDANLSDADLSDANLSGANLIDANLSGADLSGADLSGADLIGANLSDADLSDANLSGADLIGANLSDADLSDANLRRASVGGSGCDLSSIGVAHDPNLPGKVLEAVKSGGELEMGQWHTCETSHCLAGWAVHLSGPAGKALEAVTSPSVAGALLMPTASHLFYENETEAMAWLEQQASKAAH